MDRAARLISLPVRAALSLFALYAVVTVPSLVARWGVSPLGFGLLAAWLGLAAMAWPIARERVPPRGFWPLLVVVAAGLRLAALALCGGRVPTGDPATYLDLTRGLLAGDGLVFHDDLLKTSFVALYPPVYPLLLAGLGGVFGLGQGVVWASNLALDLGCAALIVRLGCALAAPAGGRAAAWLFAIWPSFALAAPLAQKEPLVLALTLGIVLLMLRLRTRAPGWRDGAGLGVLAALLALTQPGLALFPGVLGIALSAVVGWRRLWATAWRAAPFALAAMLPWWLRNAALLDHFVPLTSTGGIGLWIGNNPDATGNWMPLPAAWAGMGEIELSARAATEAKAWMAARPIEVVRLTMTKLVRAMGIEQFGLLRTSLLTPSPTAAVLAALLPVCQGALLTLLAGSAAVAGRALRSAGGAVAMLLLAACLLDIALFAVWFEFGERHRYFAMPFLLLVAGLVLARRGQAISASQPGNSASEASSRNRGWPAGASAAS